MSADLASVESAPEGALVPLETDAPDSLPPDERPAPSDAYADRPYRPDPLYHIVMLGLCTAVIALAFVMSVRSQTQVLVPVLGVPLPDLCLAKRWSGGSCPGCGMTRCFISLAHGQWREALHYNLAGPLLFAMMAFQIPFRIVQLVRIRRGLPEIRLGPFPQVLFGVLGVLMVGQWLLRFLDIGF
jgi:hypothetical protein